MGPSFTLGQPPHTLWGDVVTFLNGTRTTLANVRVEIIDGPNKGGVRINDEKGRYRFDNLVGSPMFHIRIAKTHYQTLTRSVFNEDLFGFVFRHNEQVGVGLMPN